MPIDINAILATFQAPLSRQWNPITEALEKIGEKISEQAEHSSALERSSRDFLEWPFQDDALVVGLATSQRFTIHLRPEPLLPASIRQEWLLPGLFIRLRGIVDSIHDAVRRYNRPRPEMFNRGGSQFTDIFGQAALLVRAFVLDYRPVRLLEETALQAGILRVLYLGPPQPGQAEASSGSSLDSLPGMLAGMLLVIPAVVGWISLLAREFSLAIRIRVLTEFEGIQGSLFSMRRSLLEEFFEGLRSTLQSVMEFMFAVEHIFLRSVAYYGVFLRVWLTHFARSLSEVGRIVTLAVNILILVVNALATALESFFASFGFDPGALLDLVSGGTLTGWLANKISDMAEAVGRDSPRLRAMAGIVRALARASLNPRYNIAPVLQRMPDPYAAIAPYVPGLLGVLRDLRAAVTPAVSSGLRDTAAAFGQMADAADAAARDAAHVGSRSLWRTLVQSSAQISELAFAGQISERQQARDRRLPEGTYDPGALARSYDRMLAGGFSVIAGAIPRFVAGVTDWWRARQAAQPRGSVSPHILARRARLSRVHMPRLRFDVHGYDLESEERREALQTRLQRVMREQVETAWGRGEVRVAAS